MSAIRIGVVGCGAIAQVHHLPTLQQLSELFTVTAVCDVSAGASEFVAQKFNIAKHFTDYRDLISSELDAVLLCQTDPKTDAALAVLNSGRHLFVEKPVCFSLQEIDAICAARQSSGKVGQVGYMKIYDPAYEFALSEISTMKNIRFVQVNHLHPDNSLHMRQFDIRRFNDVPAPVMESASLGRDASRLQAIGKVSKEVGSAFYLLSGSMIHDLYTMRGALGVPSRVRSCDIWSGGRAVTMNLEYPNGSRCVASWVDLPDLWDFRETLEVYGDDKRVIVSYPTGFAPSGMLASVTVQGITASGVHYTQTPKIDWESAFSRELRHFSDCIQHGAVCRTSVEDSRHDVKLIIDLVKAFRDN